MTNIKCNDLNIKLIDNFINKFIKNDTNYLNHLESEYNKLVKIDDNQTLMDNYLKLNITKFLYDIKINNKNDSDSQCWEYINNIILKQKNQKNISLKRGERARSRFRRARNIIKTKKANNRSKFIDVVNKAKEENKAVQAIADDLKAAESRWRKISSSNNSSYRSNKNSRSNKDSEN